jgi:hypothetical protein
MYFSFCVSLVSCSTCFTHSLIFGLVFGLNLMADFSLSIFDMSKLHKSVGFAGDVLHCSHLLSSK